MSAVLTEIDDKSSCEPVLDKPVPIVHNSITSYHAEQFCFWGGGGLKWLLAHWDTGWNFFSFRIGKTTALSKYHKSIESVMRSIGSKRRLALASSTYKGRYQCFLSFELQKYPVSPRFPCQYGTIPTKTLNVSNVLPEFYIPPVTSAGDLHRFQTSIFLFQHGKKHLSTIPTQSSMSRLKEQKVKPGLCQEKTVTRRWPL